MGGRKVKERGRRDRGMRWRRGVKAGVEVCCINVLYSKSYVGGPRALAAEPRVLRALGDKEGLKIVGRGNAFKVSPSEAFVDASTASNGFMCTTTSSSVLTCLDVEFFFSSCCSLRTNLTSRQPPLLFLRTNPGSRSGLLLTEPTPRFQ